jgi:hypothetical protein
LDETLSGVGCDDCDDFRALQFLIKTSLTLFDDVDDDDDDDDDDKGGEAAGGRLFASAFFIALATAECWFATLLSAARGSATLTSAMLRGSSAFGGGGDRAFTFFGFGGDASPAESTLL